MPLRRDDPGREDLRVVRSIVMPTGFYVGTFLAFVGTATLGVIVGWRAAITARNLIEDPFADVAPRARR